jgi:hypothetical protein
MYRGVDGDDWEGSSSMKTTRMLTSSASVDHLFLIRKIYEACNGKLQLRVMMYVAFSIIGGQPKITIGYYFNAVKLLPCQHGQSLEGCEYDGGADVQRGTDRPSSMRYLVCDVRGGQLRVH